MAQYLSPEWFTEMEAAAASYETEAADRAVRLRETISGSPYGDLTYLLVIENGKLTISRDPDEKSDVNFSQDYETAASLHRAEMSTQEAFFKGKVRVSGHLNTLLENAALMKGVAPAFAAVREATTY